MYDFPRNDPPVPRISEFSGVVVYMFFEDHPPPHCHVLYAGDWAKLSLRGKLVTAWLPRRVLTRVRPWILEHRAELVANWERIEEGQEPKEVSPP